MTTRLQRAAKALLDDVRQRHPGEELYCLFMREIDAALSEDETVLPGLKVSHQVISPACRANRTPEGALDEAIDRIRTAYVAYVTAPSNLEVNWHLVMTREQV